MKTSRTSPLSNQDDWHCGGWADHQRTRFDATHGTTLLERLMWLESASAFTRELAGSQPVDAPAFASIAPSGVAEDAGIYGTKKPKTFTG